MPGSQPAPTGAGNHSRGVIPAAVDRRSNSEQDREVGLLLSVAPSHLLSVYGYWAIPGIVGLEGIGIPFPGEATLILAPVYAGSTHHLDIRLVIAAAAARSVAGTITRFSRGRELDYPRLLCYAH